MCWSVKCDMNMMFTMYTGTVELSVLELNFVLGLLTLKVKPLRSLATSVFTQRRSVTSLDWYLHTFS